MTLPCGVLVLDVAELPGGKAVPSSWQKYPGIRIPCPSSAGENNKTESHTELSFSATHRELRKPVRIPRKKK